MHNCKVHRRAKGVKYGNRRKIFVALPPELFKTISKRAFKKKIAFNQEIMILAQCGLRNSVTKRTRHFGAF